LNPELTLEEIFGPVATVHTFASDEQALALSNQTPYGLAAYVFGEESHCWKVARGIRAGITKINGVTMLNLNPLAPRPAWGLSGLGDEGSRETFEFFRGSRLIGVAARPGAGDD
jgi:acyl-CoA reductase-like NAD-dependent aldehyde dehydrogenase